MSATIATLPRAGGNGAALVVVVADLLRDLYVAMTKKAAPEATAAVDVATAKPTQELSIWQLYRLTVGYDFVSPNVAAELRKQLVD